MLPFLRPTSADDLPQLLALYNSCAGGRALFDPITVEEFHALFLPDTPFANPDDAASRKFCLTAVSETGECLGFASGSVSPSAPNAYITCVVTKYEGRGIGKALLLALEAELKSFHPALAHYRIMFYNPALLRWRVPETGGALHPGMPGVDLGSRAYVWFQNMGYRNYTFFNAYYKKISGGVPEPEKILEKRKANEARGLRVTLYDRAKHGSLEPLLDSLGSAGWRGTLLRNEARAVPLPLMVAVDETSPDENGRAFVCGFAGPMLREESGRGYFAGIGIHASYRQCGLGSTLFAALCRGLSDVGADYMTLFTGENGTARKIYEAAGFRTARSFAGMEK
ncbi:MAG: GNAT family N-acetyltransferase [Eubacteriales bacterium]